jgi:SNF2 family DNA or RNA helicase
MILTPRPWQIEGADFLASRKAALLYFDCRVGKTGSALLAANKINAEHVAVITTRSGIPVWQRAFDQWNLKAPRRTLVSWGQPDQIQELSRLGPYTLIVDECHKAVNPAALRTIATYGQLEVDGLFHRENAAVYGAERTWCLSATPSPHDNGNWWPMIRSLAPELLVGKTVVRSWSAFRERYCVIGQKRLPNGTRRDVVIGGKNGDELGERLKPFFLRRTQADVGISQPTYDILPLNANPRYIAAIEAECGVDERMVLAAAEAGDTSELELALSSLLKATGVVKAEMAAMAAREDLENGTDKIVLAYWHQMVGDRLADALAEFGVLRLDGSTKPTERGIIQRTWETDPTRRVFLAQMEAAGEAIDLSASASMIIVEPVFKPATMMQMALRITNMKSKRTPLVRVAVLTGSIDEKVQERLLSLWSSIREVMK